MTPSFPKSLKVPHEPRPASLEGLSVGSGQRAARSRRCRRQAACGMPHHTSAEPAEGTPYMVEPAAGHFHIPTLWSVVSGTVATPSTHPAHPQHPPSRCDPRALSRSGPMTSACLGRMARLELLVTLQLAVPPDQLFLHGSVCPSAALPARQPSGVCDSL